MVDQVGPVHQFQGLAHVVVGDQYAQAPLLEPSHDFLHFIDGNGVYAAERLVQEQQFRTGNQRARDFQAPLLPAAQQYRPCSWPRRARSSSSSRDLRRKERSFPLMGQVSKMARMFCPRPSACEKRTALVSSNQCPGAPVRCMGRRVMSRFWNRTVPSSGLTMPTTILKVVVLPAPFGPSKPTISPASTWMETPLTTRR
jgi:hypothetical protein